MVQLSAYLTLVPLVAALPQMAEMGDLLQERTEPPPRAPLFVSQRTNCGPFRPCFGFNAEEQLVKVTGEHAYKKPGPNDQRGECPGLNAAANHGYIPRNGVVTAAQTITGLAAAFNMGPDLALFLAVISIALGGDAIRETWSIGGPFKTQVTSGIIQFHNRYEGDSSSVFGDAYLNGGQVGVFQERSWNHLYNLGTEYTLDDLAAQSDYVTRWSRLNNPYYFQAVFSGLVAPAAHNFIINFMSNHSAEAPSGILNRDVLKTFYGVTGNKNGKFVINRGTERIPEDWYKRPVGNQYHIADVFGDLIVMNGMYPGIISFGGNTGKVDTYTGLDLSDLTGGVYNIETLFEGNNLACFALQAALAVKLDALDSVLGTVSYLTGKLGPLQKELECPQLESFNSALFDVYPGASYTG